jgi:hypothetical protein
MSNVFTTYLENMNNLLTYPLPIAIDRLIYEPNEIVALSLVGLLNINTYI